MNSQIRHMETQGTSLTAPNEIKGERPQKSGLTAKRVSVFILILFGVALSAVFPYGIGLAVVAWVIALIGALIGVGFATYTLLKELLGKTATFGYAPTAAYMAGKKTKKKKAEDPSEDKESR